MTTVMGVRLDKRNDTSIEFQKILTKFGCIIKTRLGLHNVSCGVCAPNGIILLELIDDEEANNFRKELETIEGIEIQTMHFA